jgi:hypothetical protein
MFKSPVPLPPKMRKTHGGSFAHLRKIPWNLPDIALYTTLPSDPRSNIPILKGLRVES